MEERGKSGRKIYSDDADAGGKPDLQAGSPDDYQQPDYDVL